MTVDSYMRLTGYEPGLTEGTFRLYHPDDAARAEQDVLLTMQGAFTEAEYRIVTRSGDLRWIYMRRYPVWNAARDQVVAYYGVAQNITRRKEAEEALRLSEERYRRITELISDYAFLYRTDGSDALKPVWITEDSFYRLTGYTPAQGGGAYQLYHPDDEERAREDVERTLAGETVEAEYRIITGSGVIRWIYMRRYPVWNKTHDEVIALYGVAQDVTGRKLVEMEEREQRTLVEALLDTAQALNSTFDLDEMLRRILTNIDRVVPHDVSTVMLIKDSEAYVVCSRETSPVGQHRAIQEFRLTLAATPNLKQVVETRQPMLVADTHKYAGWQKVPGGEWIRSNVCIPIQQSGEVIGFLTCDSAVPGFFTPRMLKGLEAFAHQTALAMTSARLYEEGKELAILAERQRLARDLHDAVTQTMFSASMIAETLPRLQPEQMRRGLTQLQQLTRGAVAEMRALLLELRPEALEGMALTRLVGQLVDAFSGQTGIVPVFEAAAERPLPQDVKIMLYRIAQEAFNNISKHARSTAVHVSLTFEPVVKLMIEDNGRGFIPEQIKSGSLGLKIMRERAEQNAARLLVESVPGKRTLITVEWTEPDA
jgi:PAS domain S-box-containing protein